MIGRSNDCLVVIFDVHCCELGSFGRFSHDLKINRICFMECVFFVKVSGYCVKSRVERRAPQC